jgi:hypothetical protein
MHTRSLLAISATPIQLFPANANPPTLETVIVSNLGGSAATAYLKIWVDRDSSPSGAADIVLPVPVGDRQWSPFALLPGVSWIACTVEAGAGTTAAADDVNALVCWS